MILNKYRYPVELKLYYYDSIVKSKISFKDSLKDRRTHPALLVSMITQQMRRKFKKTKITAENTILVSYDRKQVTPKWMQTYKEFLELHDILTDKTGFLFSKEADPNDFIKYNVNINGIINKFTLILDAVKPSDITNEVELHSTWVHYRGIGKPFHLTLHRSDKILIPDLNKKVFLKPDNDNLNLFIDTSKIDLYSIKPQNYTLHNLLDLINPKKKLPFKIDVVFRQGTPLRFINIKDYLKSNDNIHIIKEMSKAFKKDNSVFKLNEVFYIYDMNTFREHMKDIYSYLMDEDSNKFLRMLKKAKKVEKDINFRTIRELESSKFNANLYEHQKIGVSWLYTLYNHNIPGAILGDDMGMGKTIQSIAFLSLVEGEILIICPASVVGSWESEIRKFNPDLMKRVSIMSYEKYIRMKGLHVEVIVFDEAQKMKNANTHMSSHGKITEAKFKLLLTGTPIENTVKDLHTLVGIIMPFSSNALNNMYSMFSKRAEVKIAAMTKDLIAGIYLGRKKTSKELAATMTISNIYIQPTKDEYRLYENIRKIYSKNFNNTSAANSIEYYNEMIIGLTRLRQAVSEPNMVPLELFPRNTNINKPVKLKKLKEIVDKYRKLNEKIVVFAQYKDTIELIAHELGEDKCSIIDGSVPKNIRTKLIYEFQTGDDKDVFIISLKAGGTGITLTAANHVIMYDLWWNPAIEAQAFARVHRIGQTKNVTAERLVVMDSIDNVVVKVLYNKQKVINAFDNSDGSNFNKKNIIKQIGSMMFGV